LDANVRDRLSVNKPASQKFDVKRSDIKRTSEGEVEEYNHVQNVTDVWKFDNYVIVGTSAVLE
jgi:hypothetical protein